MYPLKLAHPQETNMQVMTSTTNDVPFLKGRREWVRWVELVCPISHGNSAHDSIFIVSTIKHNRLDPISLDASKYIQKH
jgi:hypothetical protein